MAKQALVVHSDRATRSLLEQWIRGEGYSAHSVRRADEVAKVAQRAELDLIIVDRQAPDAEWSDVILNLVANPRSARIPIAFINADADQPPIIGLSRAMH